MNKVAILTDSSSGITQKEGKELGLSVLPMPFYINDKIYYEDIDLTQDDFYRFLEQGVTVTTSSPLTGKLLERWNELLQTYDEIVYVPLSSGLSGTCANARILAEDFDGRVEVVNNQRVSVTERYSALEALSLANQGACAREIREKLEETRFDSSIYIMVDTLTYLKKGGRLTPAAAAIGTFLHLKPVLQIQGDVLDSYAKVRSVRQAKKKMIEAVKQDAANRFGGEENCVFHMAYTHNPADLEIFREEAMKAIPGKDPGDFYAAPLSLNIACHIGPGALALTCAKKHDF